MMQNITRAVREFYALASAGAPAVPHCKGCGIRFLPPRAVCPQCGGTQLAWHDVTGAAGTVYSITRKTDGTAVVLADLDDIDGGGRMLAQVIGDDVEDLQIGDPVILDTVEADFELADRVPAFRRGAAK